MKRADLKVGFCCNNHCRHCVQGNKRERFGNKSLETIKKELKMASRGCGEVVLTGGEPTIHRDFLEIVRFAKKLGFILIQLQTNGRMLYYKKLCQEAIEAGVNSFVIALEGHCSRLHDYITTSEGSFNQAVTAILNLKSLKQYVAINSVISKLNYRHLPQMAEFFVSLGVDQYQFAFVHPSGNALENFYSIVPRMCLIQPYVKQGLDIGIKARKLVMTEAIPYCFMEGYEDYIGEKFIPETKIYDYKRVTDNFTQVRQKEGKSKGSLCRKCRYYRICEGPWREYPENFGWSEFIPVKVK